MSSLGADDKDAPTSNGAPPPEAPALAPPVVTPTPVVERRQKAPPSAAIGINYEGPIPPPGFMQGYERALPGAADRLLKIWESEVQHRQETERQNHAHVREEDVKQALHVRQEDARQGEHERWMARTKLSSAVGLFLFFTIVGVLLVANGYKTEGYAVFLTPILAAVVKFGEHKWDQHTAKRTRPPEAKEENKDDAK